MTWAWVSLGSNVDRERSIRGAVSAMRRRYGNLVISRVYESAAVGFDGEPFFNLVVGFETGKSAEDLCRELLELETVLGRVRGPEKFAPRTLDADLLVYGDLIVEGGRCRLPREEILRYAFVLRPLAEVAGDALHPIRRRSFRDLWSELRMQDQSLKPVDLVLD